MESLGKLFGSTARIKLMRLFLFHPGKAYDIETLKKRTRTDSSAIRRELTLLTSISFLKKKQAQVTLKSGKKKMAPGWTLNNSFGLNDSLRTLLIESELIGGKDIASRFQSAGRVKFLALGGIFARDEQGIIDILLVGDRFARPALERILAVLESEVGKELRYVLFTPEEFAYRMSMYDSFLRQVLGAPHEKVINTLGDVGI